jgi:hypothetical protein
VPALFIDAEDDEITIHIRLDKILRYYGVRFADVAKYLHIVSWVAQDTVLATAGTKTNKVVPTKLYAFLLEMVGDLKPGLISIASSANVFAGNENDRSQVQQFVGLTTKVARVGAKSGLVLTSHPSLVGISSDTGLSGTTQWHNAMRARYFIRSIKPAEGEQPDNDLREIVFKKNQYGKVADTIKLRWQNGLFLPIGAAAFDAATRGMRIDEVFVTLLRKFNAGNRNVSATPGTIFAPSLFEKEREARELQATRIELGAAMRRMLDEGKISQEQYGKPSRPAYRLVVRSAQGVLRLVGGTDTIKVGDMVMVEINGELVFKEPVRVRAVDGEWLFVEGSQSGLRREQVRRVDEAPF